MCWYTDSVDNSFVIDYVPGYNQSLFVASGGSGHGFKFLPVLGKVCQIYLEHGINERILMRVACGQSARRNNR